MRTRHLLIVAIPLACALAIAACAGNGNGLDANGRPIDSGGQGSNGELTADFQSIQDHVFTPICSVCHAGGGAPQGLRLDAANSYDLLVGVPSTEVPSLLRIKAGDPDHSYLVQKIEGHAAVGAQMPFGGPPLPAATIAVIRQWVTDGAQRGQSAAASKPFAVMSTWPMDGDVLASAPTRLLVAFNRELDQTRIDSQSLRVERVADAGGDGSASAVEVQLRVPEGNPAAILLEPAAALAPGSYRIVTSAENGAALTDLSGEGLPSTDTTLTNFTVGPRP